MTKIETIIKPFGLDEVRDALTAIGIHGMTVTSETRGFDRQRGRVDVYHDAEIAVSFIPKVKLEVVVEDAMAGKVITAIREKAKTGKIGDGKIFVTRLADVVRVRTGEHGRAAI